MKNNYGAVILENSELHEHCVNHLSLLEITCCNRVMCFFILTNMKVTMHYINST